MDIGAPTEPLPVHRGQAVMSVASKGVGAALHVVSTSSFVTSHSCSSRVLANPTRLGAHASIMLQRRNERTTARPSKREGTGRSGMTMGLPVLFGG